MAKTALEKKIATAIRLLEHNGYIITPPASPVTVSTAELNKRKMQPRKEAFIEELRRFTSIYPPDMLNEFYQYWTEPNRTFTKMRFEMQKTWSLDGRLRTWSRNYKKKNNNNGRREITDNDRISKLADILTD